MFAFFRDKSRDYDKCIERLNRVIDAMEELLVLKKQYNLHVNFDEYFQVFFDIFRNFFRHVIGSSNQLFCTSTELNRRLCLKIATTY